MNRGMMESVPLCLSTLALMHCLSMQNAARLFQPSTYIPPLAGPWSTPTNITAPRCEYSSTPVPATLLGLCSPVPVTSATTQPTEVSEAACAWTPLNSIPQLIANI
uniref:Secreted protein n=1 Tax=Cyclophora tenuis TaxID=216820 RepID=A0A7S1CZ15_CYCTE